MQWVGKSPAQGKAWGKAVTGAQAAKAWQSMKYGSGTGSSTPPLHSHPIGRYMIGGKRMPSALIPYWFWASWIKALPNNRLSSVIMVRDCKSLIYRWVAHWVEQKLPRLAQMVHSSRVQDNLTDITHKFASSPGGPHDLDHSILILLQAAQLNWAAIWFLTLVYEVFSHTQLMMVR